MKKIIAILLLTCLVFNVVACGGKTAEKEVAETQVAEEETVVEEEPIKIGMLCLHDENSTYDANFINAFNEACEKMEVDGIIKTGIPETNECYEAAVDLVDRGCDIVFGDSFGHESFLIQAAQEFPEVQFCHATGTNAHTSDLANLHNAFASIYQGRYVAGVVAGMKLNEMIEKGEITEADAKVGYVGAFTYAEVISGYTSWFLGVRSVCPSATMEVQFTGSWYDEALEKEACQTLINNGCVLISQHADSMGAPTACEEAGIPNVSYNGSTLNACPKTFLVSSKINWEPYFEYIISCVKEGNNIATDWVGGFENGSVQLTELNGDAVADGTFEAVDKAIDDVSSGKIKVFDTSTFTVNGEELTSYMADVDTDENYEKDTEAIKDGYFHESEFRSAPYFDIAIDGITTLNAMY